MEWKSLVGAFINTIAVVGLVQIIKIWLPILNVKVPWLLPIIAGAVGPLIAVIQNILATWLGVAIDLSPLAAVFTGGSAVALYQIGKQAEKKGG